jgi:gas vesicle structural protein
MSYVADVELGPDGKPIFPLTAPPPAKLAPQASPGASEVDEDEHVSLCDVLDRVLNKGVVVKGEIVITVADIELLYLGVELLLCSVDKARRVGVRMPRDMTVPPILNSLARGADGRPLKALE